jgi:RNA-directed DNA polymerase
MTKAPIGLQDLRRRIYVKAKTESSWRFWGLYVHICKMETLCVAYEMAKKNNGAPGMDGVTFEAIEEGGRSFYSRYRTNLSPTRIGPHRFGERRSRRTGVTKSAFFRFPQFATAWFKVR